MHNSKAKMDEFKTKVMDLLHKQTQRQMKIPAMGFSDYFIQTVTADAAPIGSDKVDNESVPADASTEFNNAQKSDQEILESIESCYYNADYNTSLHELQKVLAHGVNQPLIETTIGQLRTQQKVLTKQVLQNILEQRNACSSEFTAINNTQKQLEESLWTCQKARSYLNYARSNLTTSSLEILASYRKREVLKELLDTLLAIKQLRNTDVEVQKLLADDNYSGAIALLLQCKRSADAYMQYTCVQSLQKKLQETMLLMELQLDTVLNEMVLGFDMRKYAKLQEAYELLNKSLIAMDQLHISYISAIHASVNAVLRGYSEPQADEHVKPLYEQMCEQLAVDKLLPCLISLCKTMWTILASYYQVIMWHNNKLYATTNRTSVSDTRGAIESQDTYIQEKLKKGQSRIWNDMLNKVCVFLQTVRLTTLKHDQFIQVLCIVQRLQRVGVEFCGEQSEKLIETMQQQSVEFFTRYHNACVEEICLFLDNESWTSLDSFTHIMQLPEFRALRLTLRRHKSPSNNSPISQNNTIATNNTNHTINTAIIPNNTTTTTTTTTNHNTNNNNHNNNNNNCDELVSVHSQDGGSSIYGSYGYFLRFSEKSSPFDGGLDATLLEQDILSGIVDEASCYFSEESDDEQKSLPSKEFDPQQPVVVMNNTALNVCRCIGRYLQMCKLLHGISPKIIGCMLELLDFYAYAVHEIFARDAVVGTDNLYSPRLLQRLRDVESQVLPHIKVWPMNFSSLANNELANADTLYGLQQRIVAIEAGQSMQQQFLLLQHYLNHLLPPSERSLLSNYLDYDSFMADVAKPVYTCVTSRIIDLPAILNQMGKIKWDVHHVIQQHSSYSDVMNRNIQNFAMRLEEIAKEVLIPSAQIWNSMAHVATRLLVEGFSMVKKCSAGGRALMQLDFANFMSFLELISNQKFPQHRAYVDVFVKTYYYSAEQFEQWIEVQRNFEQYSSKQLTSLIQCICVGDKRTRQRLLQLLQQHTGDNNVVTPTTQSIDLTATAAAAAPAKTQIQPQPNLTKETEHYGGIVTSNLSNVI